MYTYYAAYISRQEVVQVQQLKCSWKIWVSRLSDFREWSRCVHICLIDANLDSMLRLAGEKPPNDPNLKRDIRLLRQHRIRTNPKALYSVPSSVEQQ